MMTDTLEGTPTRPNRTQKLMATGVIMCGLAALIASVGVLAIGGQWQSHPRIVLQNPETKAGFEIVNGTWRSASLRKIDENETTVRPYLLDKDTGRIWIGPSEINQDGEWKEVKVQGISPMGFR